MTAPLRWRSQLCPCGFCPPGTRVEWRYSLDIRFRPQRRQTGSARAHDDVRKALRGTPEGEGGGP